MQQLTPEQRQYIDQLEQQKEAARLAWNAADPFTEEGMRTRNRMGDLMNELSAEIYAMLNRHRT